MGETPDTADSPLDVVAVGAHPDDVEMSCGGTLAKLSQQGYRVGIIDLTDGEPTPNCPDPQVRLAEAREAASVLEVSVRVTLDLGNRRLFDTFESRVALAKQLRRHRPAVVIGFGDRTPMASPDHWQAMQITDAAVFYARLTKWDDQFDHLPPHTVAAQLYFWPSLMPRIPADSPGHFIVDISDTLQKKLSSVQCYKSQFPEHKQHVIGAVETGDRYIGSLAGCEAGERFVGTRPIMTNDLMGVLFPAMQRPRVGPLPP